MGRQNRGLKKMTTVDEMFDRLACLKVEFEDEAGFRKFLFEYACQTAEYEEMDPKVVTGYIDYLMVQKLADLEVSARKVYDDYENMTRFAIQPIDINKIPEIVRNEHGM